MTPQFQKYSRNNPEGNVYGDCHRTCIAMVLDLPRDEVPHFMDGVPPNCDPNDPPAIAALEAERTWLAQHGVAPVSIPFPGELDLQVLLDMFKINAVGCAVVLGCSSTNGCGHSVVLYDGELYNPNDGGIAGPMQDGMWWITIYSVTTKPLTQAQAPGTVVTQEAG